MPEVSLHLRGHRYVTAAVELMEEASLARLEIRLPMQVVNSTAFAAAGMFRSDIDLEWIDL